MSKFADQFVEDGGLDATMSGATAIIAALNDKSKYKGASTGNAIGTTVGSAAGAFGGPVGVAIGGMVGGVAGSLIGGVSDKRNMKEDYNKEMYSYYGDFNPLYLGDKHGSMAAPYAQEGMLAEGDLSMQSPTGEQPQMQPQTQTLNIEKGELLVDPNSMEVLQEFKNPNRFTKHNKNPFLEKTGNFVDVPVGSIVIPSKLAKSYKEGNKLTRQSIMMEILKAQKNNPQQNAPRTGAPTMAMGGLNMFNPEDPTKPGPLLSKMNPAPNPDPFFRYAGMGETVINYKPPVGPIPADNEMDVNKAVQTAAGAEVGKMFNPLYGAQPAAAAPPPAADPVMPESNTPNYGLYAAQAANFLPTALGLARSTQKDPFLRYNDMGHSFDQAIASAQSMETKPSTQAAESAVARSMNPQVRAMMGFGSPSVRSELAKAQSDAVGRVGEIQENAVNTQMQNQNQVKAAVADLLVKKGADRLNSQNRFMDELRQDKAARENMSGAFLSEGVTNAGMMQMDQERIKAMNAMSKIVDANPYLKKMIQDDPNAMDAIMQILNMGQTVPPGVVKKPVKINTNRIRFNRNKLNQPSGSSWDTGTTTITR